MRLQTAYIKPIVLLSLACAFLLHVYVPFHSFIQLSDLKKESVSARIEKEHAATKQLVFTKDAYAKLHKPDKHEIKIGDHYFDIISISVKGDNVYCNVYADNEETELHNIISKQQSRNRHHNRTKRINFWWPVGSITHASFFSVVNHIINNPTFKNTNTWFLGSDYVAENLIPPEA